MEVVIIENNNILALLVLSISLANGDCIWLFMILAGQAWLHSRMFSLSWRFIHFYMIFKVDGEKAHIYVHDLFLSWFFIGVEWHNSRPQQAMKFLIWFYQSARKYKVFTAPYEFCEALYHENWVNQCSHWVNQCSPTWTLPQSSDFLYFDPLLYPPSLLQRQELRLVRTW